MVGAQSYNIYKGRQLSDLMPRFLPLDIETTFYGTNERNFHEWRKNKRADLF